ncbi:DNA polymerase III subunit delta' [Methylomonas sp. AM2-LC]|uniref:DNA polymerase III subunit delta' n=1 Tax=Methylomonas sp. AM2-LC TaxID=3153301 RepID=UPI0032634980
MSTDNVDIFPWQQVIWPHLLSYIDQQRIPQALLFSGPTGLGKRQLAEYYTQSLLCHAPLSATIKHTTIACGECVSCKLLKANTHPDYFVIEPDEPGKAIGIDKIRQLIAKLALKPQYETYRLVILHPADNLTTAAANAFLKCLEEPNERTCFILISDQAYKLPATIRSRCQTINFSLPKPQITEDWLQQQGVAPPYQSLLIMASGSPLLAKEYAERGFMQHRNAYFEIWLQIAQGKTNLLMVAEQWQKSDIIDLGTLINWICSWIMDIIKLAHDVDSKHISNPDFKKSLQALAKRLELKRVYQYYDILLNNKALVNTQLNKQLVTERLLIDWFQLNKS